MRTPGHGAILSGMTSHPPDPRAAEITELNGVISTLTAEVGRAHRACGDAVARLNAVIARRGGNQENDHTDP
jgi:hypothetical protein